MIRLRPSAHRRASALPAHPSLPPNRRLAVLSLLQQHAVVLCADAPQDAVRGVYEAVRDRTAQPALDGPEGTARAQLAALQTLTRLLVACEMQQRDARLVKVRCCCCCRCCICCCCACCCSGMCGRV